MSPSRDVDDTRGSDKADRHEEADAEEPKARPERAVALIGIVVLAYLLGALSAAYGAWPYPTVSKGFEALEAFVRKASLGTIASKYESTLWRVNRFQRKGVVNHDASRAWEGVTLITSGHRQGAALIDMDGEIVHEWGLSLREIWEDPPHIDSPIPEGFIHWARVHVFPNGDLLAVVVATDDTPQGYGLVKLDKDSNLLWAYAGNAHHDLHVNGDGTIWALTSQVRDLGERPLPNGVRGDAVLMDEFVVRLSPDGEELSRASLLEAIADSPYARALSWYEGEFWDPLHPNNVEPVGRRFADNHPDIDPGDLMLSLRNIDMLAAFDPMGQSIEWVARGPWRQQHDPDPLPDGTMLVYDNLGALGTVGASQVLRWDPATNAIPWKYGGTEEAPFHSEIRGTQQLLENGNVLITDTENGRVIEVTESGEIVWEYRNPNRTTHDDEELVAIVQSATRIDPATLDFL